MQVFTKCVHFPDENESVKAASIARNFIALVSTATIGELDSLEELVCMLVNSGDIEKPCFKVGKIKPLQKGYPFA